MHYKFLSELGSHYSSEEGTEGVRKAALTGLEGNLNNALMNLNALYNATVPKAPANGSVLQKAQFFKAMAEFSNKSRAEIETPRFWRPRRRSPDINAGLPYKELRSRR
jgi:hypothetical protein